MQGMYATCQKTDCPMPPCAPTNLPIYQTQQLPKWHIQCHICPCLRLDCPARCIVKYIMYCLSDPVHMPIGQAQNIVRRHMHSHIGPSLRLGGAEHKIWEMEDGTVLMPLPLSQPSPHIGASLVLGQLQGHMGPGWLEFEPPCSHTCFLDRDREGHKL